MDPMTLLAATSSIPSKQSGQADYDQLTQRAESGQVDVKLGGDFIVGGQPKYAQYLMIAGLIIALIFFLRKK